MKPYLSRSLGAKDLRRPRRFSSLFLVPLLFLVWYVTPLKEKLSPMLTDMAGSMVARISQWRDVVALQFEGSYHLELEKLRRENQHLRGYVARFYVQQRENKELREALHYV